MPDIKNFNKIFIEFMEDIYRVFPNDEDIKNAFEKSKLIIKARPNIIYKIFLENIIQHESKINNKNEQFIFQTNFSEPILTLLLDKLRLYWVVLIPDNKDILWKYLNVMIYLIKKDK
jgi:hypothetical protein